jgi:hypothetical protein
VGGPKVAPPAFPESRPASLPPARVTGSARPEWSGEASPVEGEQDDAVEVRIGRVDVRLTPSHDRSARLGQQREPRSLESYSLGRRYLDRIHY